MMIMHTQIFVLNTRFMQFAVKSSTCISLRFIGRWFIHMVAHFIVMSNKRCTICDEFLTSVRRFTVAIHNFRFYVQKIVYRQSNITIYDTCKFFVLLICHISQVFPKLIGCFNSMIKYDWLAEVSTLI